MARRRKCGETDSNRRLLSGYGGAAGWVEPAMAWMMVDGRQAGGRKKNESGLAVGARPPSFTSPRGGDAIQVLYFIGDVIFFAFMSTSSIRDVISFCICIYIIC